VVVFDFDENNVPVTARGTEGLDKYLAAYDAAVRKGLSLKTTISRDDCFGDSDMGFCTVEFDQTVGQGGQTTAPFKFRGTLVARRAKDGWRWVHWHGSFREFPPSPAAGAPASAPPATSPGAEGAAPAANEQAPPK
jgi:ketosteroid isomerase-like protein